MSNPQALEALDPGKLPGAQATLAAIAREAGDPELSINRLARLVALEPGLTVELLEAANRSVTKQGCVKTPQQAISRLGFRFVRNRAVARVVRSASAELDTGGLDVRRHWEDSLRRALAARVLAERLGHRDPEEVFTAGLLQEVGTLLLAAHDPARGEDLERVAHEPSETRMRVERELFGLTHDEVIQVVGEAWNLPPDILAPIRHHHEPKSSELGREAARTATLLAAADRIADLFVTRGDERVVHRCRQALEQLQGRGGVELAQVVQSVQKGLPKIASELGIEVGRQASVAEVLTAATSSLVQITQGYENLIQQLEEALREKQELARLLERKNHELEALAATDPLTGAANRRRFTSLAQRALKQHCAEGRPLTLLIFDLDHFKKVNDQHGHPAGDAVLVEVVRRLSLSLRADDTIARLGGEEFAALLPDTDEEGGRLAAERCRRRIAESPIDAGETSLSVTCSIGGATRTGLGSLEGLLSEADRALYHSKSSGRDRVTWFGERAKEAG
ncbi:MAG: diguanylate cyclase [Myxococcota bacterium]|nr:diguanylate cyclase [Myxococcota bacterium]